MFPGGGIPDIDRGICPSCRKIPAARAEVCARGVLFKIDPAHEPGGVDRIMQRTQAVR